MDLKTITNQIIILIWDMVDFILPDFTILVRMRARILRILWKGERDLVIRRGNRIMHIGNLSFGKGCRLNKFNFFDNGGQIKIGNYCRIGIKNIFLTVNHIEDNEHEKKGQDYYHKPIIIGNDVWITSNCTILPGTIIGDKVIVSAGSVVRGKLDSGWVYGGNPAKKIRKTRGLRRIISS